MKQAIQSDLTYFRIGLDDEAMTLLINLSEVTGKAPPILLADLVRDILVEDAEAHSDRVVAVGETRH